MKRLLIHHARPLASRAIKIPVEEHAAPAGNNVHDLSELEDLLSRLGAIDPKLRSVVEMKVFEGMSVDEIASQLGCAPRTVARHWSFARQWLQQQLSVGRDRGTVARNLAIVPGGQQSVPRPAERIAGTWGFRPGDRAPGSSHSRRKRSGVRDQQAGTRGEGRPLGVAGRGRPRRHGSGVRSSRHRTGS